jgi:exopolyphosphatase / guanosine-5'-triphosphate,3'-diphosphate pyrophosphatase
MAQDRVAQLTLSIQERAARRWVIRRLGRIGHESRVLAIASTLFDLMYDQHNLYGRHRRILRLGALVHDVGRQIDDADHPSIGSTMILKDSVLPISGSDRRRLAYLTRYHRGAVPRTGYDDILEPGDERKSMRRVLALLRAADTLDNRTVRPPRIVIATRGRRLRVTCFIEEDCGKSRRAFTRRKKFRLLEELLDCRVEVRIKLAEAVEAV